MTDYEKGETTAERHMRSGRPVESVEALRELAKRSGAADVRDFVDGYMRAVWRDERMVA